MGVLGCGAMGRHHARTAVADLRVALAWVADPDASRAQSLADELGCGTAPGPVDLAVNAAPASAHSDAFRSVNAEWWLIEKPLATSSSAAEALRGERIRVGLLERFNPALRNRTAPRQAAIRRWASPTGRGSDIDAVLDLLVHDLDLCLRWGGEALAIESARVVARGADGRIEAIEARLSAGVFHASLEVSRVASARERTAILDGERFDLTAAGSGVTALTAQWGALLDEMEGGPCRVATAAEAITGLRLAERIRDRAEGR